MHVSIYLGPDLTLARTRLVSTECRDDEPTVAIAQDDKAEIWLFFNSPTQLRILANKLLCIAAEHDNRRSLVLKAEAEAKAALRDLGAGAGQ